MFRCGWRALGCGRFGEFRLPKALTTEDTEEGTEEHRDGFAGYSAKGSLRLQFPDRSTTKRVVEAPSGKNQHTEQGQD